MFKKAIADLVEAMKDPEFRKLPAVRRILFRGAIELTAWGTLIWYDWVIAVLLIIILTGNNATQRNLRGKY